MCTYMQFIVCVAQSMKFAIGSNMVLLPNLRVRIIRCSQLM